MKEKKARKPKAAKPEVTVERLAFDKYTVVEMNRRELKSAEYNPRILGDEEKRKLKGILRRHGMVSPPTFNKRTQRVVAGHQRLSQLDSLHGSPNYTLQVAVIDVDEATEKELNVALNNPSAMGDWDITRLESLLCDKALSMEGMGFDLADAFRLFGDMPGAQAPAVDELAAKLRSFQESYTKVSDTAGRDDFYMVVVFADYARRTAFCESLKIADNRYQSGDTIMALIAEKQKGPPAEEVPPAGTKREVEKPAKVAKPPAS